jgi:hypothetical protein
MIMIRCNGFRNKLRKRGGKSVLQACREQMLVDLVKAATDKELANALKGSGWSLAKVKVSLRDSREIDALQPLCVACARKLAVAVLRANDATAKGESVKKDIGTEENEDELLQDERDNTETP